MPIVPMHLGLQTSVENPMVIHPMAIFATHGSPQFGNFRKDSDHGSGSLPKALWLITLFFFPQFGWQKNLPHPLIPRCFPFFLILLHCYCWWPKSGTSWYGNMLTGHAQPIGSFPPLGDFEVQKLLAEDHCFLVLHMFAPLRLLRCILFGPWPHRMRTKWLWIE